ncbi:MULTISPECIES: TetR/AcrR family transcriptional regulator [Streptomyces]|uniref:TetR family transcriptional regulator n=1 Tax=Streptomyces argyrophylli TaxID=2726118 RepID=A0A6M4PBN2_9ACTN|nr:MULTISPECIES: TetR/AcrR family transcriptional regulator [Streptomyces]QJS08395.1 TetR family transcriptional regulator [Streptomyces argyrophyllae]
MGRWQPNARERLAEAALELYGERGYEQTTVAEIAKRAGLTERTFFRHYADKREVLFGGAGELEDLFVRAVTGASADAAPIEAVAAGLDAVSEVFADRRAFARARHAVITANAELKERELIKLASLSTALAGTLRGRGVPEPAASLAAEAGVAVFRVGFERWLAAPGDRDLTGLVREALTEFRAVAAGG